MIDAAKYADLVLLLIDGSFGFEMETFEFLNLLQVSNETLNPHIAPVMAPAWALHVSSTHKLKLIYLFPDPLSLIPCPSASSTFPRTCLTPYLPASPPSPLRCTVSPR